MSDIDNAYDKIDSYLRNNLYDDDYAEYSDALDTVYSGIQTTHEVESLRQRVAELEVVIKDFIAAAPKPEE